MKHLLILTLVLVVGSYLGGCSSSGALALDSERQIVQGQNTNVTPVDTKEERQLRLDMMSDLQARQMQDDWDYIWLVEKSARTSPWHAGTDR